MEIYAHIADEGHIKRLDALEKQLTHHRDIAEALRAKLQRLKPEGDFSPPKHRPRHRHTSSDPTPQPAPSVTRSPRKRSRGQPKEQRGAHRRGRSEQSGSKKQDEDPFAASDHGKGASKESGGFDGALVPTGSMLQESKSTCSEGQLMRGLGIVSSGGGEGEQGADEDSQTESIVSGHRHGIIPLDNDTALHAIVEVVNTGSPSHLLTELDCSTRRLPNNTDIARQPSETDDTLVSTCAKPLSPLLQVVGEHPEAGSESEEAGSDGRENPGTSCGGEFLTDALAVILSVRTKLLYVRLVP